VFEVWWDILSALCWKFTAKSVDRWKTSEHWFAWQSHCWFPPSRNIGNVGKWRNGHTLRTLRENMETKLHQRFLLVNSYGFYVKNRNRFCSYWFHVYVTFCRIRENVYVKIFTCTLFSTLPTSTAYVRWRWKSRVRGKNIVAPFFRTRCT